MFIDGGAAGFGVSHQTALDSFLAVIFSSPVALAATARDRRPVVQTGFVHHMEHLGHTFTNALFIRRITV